MSHQWQKVLEWWHHDVLLWWHLWYDLERLLCELSGLWLPYLWECDCDLDLLYLYLSQWWCVVVDLTQCLVCHLWHAGVPDGRILSWQSTAMWPYSSHSKHTLKQLCAMWPNSWHWKHWSPSLVITLTIEEGNRAAVNCCAAWSFCTSLMASVRRVWGPLSQTWAAKVSAFLIPLTNILMVAALLVKLHLLASHLNLYM